ncbi:MAG: D-Ala-D-Ala carboxypeptidase [Desulfobulbaceae bacterium BRH_c16a]|nr:MAG: D-Ala-D-Ala carboxypeptidase [Desulfobulbaceae bacterium BRH_c16a]
MKRLALLFFVSLLIAQPAWAARAKISPIAKDPYMSALVIDADTGKVLFSDNPETIVYPASVLKMMSLLVILELIDQGKVKLDDMVQVTAEAAKIGGSQVYLDPKEQFPVEELLYALAVQSANDTAVALAIHVAGSKEGFVALMNQKAAALGMKDTQFHSVHGLPPSEGQKVDQTTATDLALLCRALIARPDSLKYTGTKERPFRDGKFIMRNHNHLLGSVDGCDGFKTGYFEAGGFSIAATAKRGGVRIIAIVMGSKDRKIRDAKAREMLALGFAAVPPKPEEVLIASAPQAAAPAPAAASPAPEPPAVQPPAEEPKTASPSIFGNWKVFLMGGVAGFMLFGLMSLFLSRKSSRKR